jgi:cytidyltransferase-like protein
MQTRHGPLTEHEILSVVNQEGLRDAIDQGYIIKHQNEARYSLMGAGRSKIKVVLGGGVYDVLHLGHLAALTEAKTLGDVLIAVVATDITVEMLKGRKPIFPQEDRRKLVEGLKPVDKAILGYEDVGMGYEEVLMEVMPDIVAFGYDQENLERSVREIITRHELRIQMVKLSRYENEKYISSTSVRQKLSETLS